jgi:hypothetical protein
MYPLLHPESFCLTFRCIYYVSWQLWQRSHSFPFAQVEPQGISVWLYPVLTDYLCSWAFFLHGFSWMMKFVSLTLLFSLLPSLCYGKVFCFYFKSSFYTIIPWIFFQVSDYWSFTHSWVKSQHRCRLFSVPQTNTHVFGKLRLVGLRFDENSLRELISKEAKWIWRCDSRSRIPDLQVWSPKFKY